jgi:hypothetical protein
MRRMLSAAGLALAMAAGSFAVAPVAFAQSVQFEIGPDGVKPVDPYRDRDRDREFRRGGGCSPREARAAARDEGLRDVEIVRVTNRSVVVEGDNRRGDTERMRFANAPGCPEI